MAYLQKFKKGEMAEWSIAAVLKTVELQGSGGSNPSLSVKNGSTPKRVDFKGQHQSQWILMKDAALDKDPQSIIFKVFIAVG